MARTSPSRSEQGMANKQAESKLWKTLMAYLSLQKNKDMLDGSTKLPNRLLFGTSKQCMLLFPFALSKRIYTEHCFECVWRQKGFIFCLYFPYLWEVQSYQRDLGRHSLPPSDIYPNYQIQHISSTVWTSDYLPGTCTDKEVYFQLMMQEIN